MNAQTCTPADILACLSGGADITLTAPAWISWRSKGLRVMLGIWVEAGSLRDALAQSRPASGQPASGQPDAPQPDARHPDTIELCLTHDWRQVAATELERVFSSRMRGRIGLSIRGAKREVRLDPLSMITRNRSAEREIRAQHLLSGQASEAWLRDTLFQRFAGRSFLIRLGDTPKVDELYRGGQVVAPEAVGEAMLADTAQGMCDWLHANVAADGTMTYKYWPSRGTTSKANNTIRQFMATVALGRIAAQSQDARHAEIAVRNLDWALATFHQQHDGFDAITYNGSAKLGAMALAAMAVLEFREAGLIAPEAHRAIFDGLCATITHLWQPDGAFRTFLVPPERNDNQNFYPGEALLFWARLHRSTKDPALAARCLQSFAYYNAWHRAQPNPALVPWHVQAYVMLHQDLSDGPARHALAEFVFERSDWLLAMQQWGGDVAPDFQGRFYSPKHPEYGPPHASATGVYMEGLADAWRLAVDLGETARAQAYALALRRGLRAMRQLQFRNREICAFYIGQPSRVMGGLRTETWNNEIRVDNVQHGLMALMKLQAWPDFPWGPAT